MTSKRMSDTAKKKAAHAAHLEESRRHIVEAQVRIARQSELLKELERNRRDTKQAQRLLGALEKTLVTMRGHHQTLLAERKV